MLSPSNGGVAPNQEVLGIPEELRDAQFVASGLKLSADLTYMEG